MSISRLPHAEDETRSSRRQRRSALTLLCETGVEPRAWVEPRPLLGERDPEMLVRLAPLASAAAGSDERSTAAARLVSVMSELPWHIRDDAEQALVALAPEASSPVRSELLRRSSKPVRERARTKS